MKRLTDSEKKQIVSDVQDLVENSNLTVAAACKQIGVTPHTFYVYKRLASGSKKRVANGHAVKGRNVPFKETILNQAYGKIGRQAYDTLVTAQW